MTFIDDLILIGYFTLLALLVMGVAILIFA